jgi:hypothetical protein
MFFYQKQSWEIKKNISKSHICPITVYKFAIVHQFFLFKGSDLKCMLITFLLASLAQKEGKWFILLASLTKNEPPLLLLRAKNGLNFKQLTFKSLPIQIPPLNESN